MVPVVLWAPRKKIKSFFIVDTGSPNTILNYTDSIRLGIPHIAKGGIIRMGGRRYKSHVYRKFEIIFKSTDDKEIRESLPIRVLTPTSPKAKAMEELDAFPNILGMDFLKKKGYRLHCDLEKDNIYLEK